MDVVENMRRLAATMKKADHRPREPLRLYSPGPNATRVWREMFGPDIEIVELGEVPHD